jgi:hypothetical protein
MKFSPGRALLSLRGDLQLCLAPFRIQTERRASLHSRRAVLGLFPLDDDLENKIAFRANEFRKRDNVDGGLNRVVDERRPKIIEEPSEVISPETAFRPEGDVRQTCGKRPPRRVLRPWQPSDRNRRVRVLRQFGCGHARREGSSESRQLGTSRMTVGTEGAIAVIEVVGRKSDAVLDHRPTR